MTPDFLDKYPRTKKLLEESEMSLAEALIWSEREINKLKR